MQPTPNDANESESDEEAVPQRPAHNVSHVPDYPTRTLCSGLRRNAPGGGSASAGCNGGGGGNAMLVLDDDVPPVAFSAGLPGRIQLLQLPDPWNVHEAMAAPDADGWRDAMNKEMENLRSHDVYELVSCTPSMCTLRLSWVLHCKFKNSIFNKNKAHLVARGNQQRPGVDYNESFSLVMCLESLCTMLAIAAIRDYDIIQFNIMSAYLHGTLKEELYMEQPDGYTAPGKEDHIWRLKKGLYGLVQAGRTWNEELNDHMESVGFTVAQKDPTIYSDPKN